MSKRALICGISGQDGAFLAKLLLERGYEIWGSSRDAELNQFENLRRLGVYDSVRLVSLSLRDTGSTIVLLSQIRPDQVFNLAGQSSVGLSFEQPVETFESIAVGTLTLLEAIRITDAGIRLYDAGSTECFGDTGSATANEKTRFSPRSPYAVAKASSFWAVAHYREAYNLFACTGILSNHDSPLRPRRFVTRKIIHAAASLALQRDARLTLGNLQISRDWGWAPEYVQAIALMLEQSSAQDYVIATGQSHTLAEFIDCAFRLIGRDWREHVTVDERLFRPADILCSRTDPGKANIHLGWKAEVGMEHVVSRMLESEIRSLRDER